MKGAQTILGALRGGVEGITFWRLVSSAFNLKDETARKM